MTAIAHVALAEISARSKTGGSVSLFEAVPLGTAVLKSTPASAQLIGGSVPTTLEATGPNQFWRITAIGSAVWVKVGNSPVAEPQGDGCWYLEPGTPPLELSALPGQRVAICE